MAGTRHKWVEPWQSRSPQPMKLEDDDTKVSVNPDVTPRPAEDRPVNSGTATMESASQSKAAYVPPHLRRTRMVIPPKVPQQSTTVPQVEEQTHTTEMSKLHADSVEKISSPKMEQQTNSTEKPKPHVDSAQMRSSPIHDSKTSGGPPGGQSHRNGLNNSVHPTNPTKENTWTPMGANAPPPPVMTLWDELIYEEKARRDRSDLAMKQKLEQEAKEKAARKERLRGQMAAMVITGGEGPLNTMNENDSSDSDSLSFASPAYTVISQKDVRGQKPKVFYDTQDWNATRFDRQKNKWDSESLPSFDYNKHDIRAQPTFRKTEDHFHQFIDSWVERVPILEGDDLLRAKEIVRGTQMMDTATGKLLDHPKAPHTVGRCKPSQPLAHLARILTELTGKVDESKRPIVQKVRVQTSAHSTTEWLGRQRRKDEHMRSEQRKIEIRLQIRELEEARENKTNPFLCREPAHIRPAEPDDMMACCTIYAQEVSNGWRALDQVAPGVEKFQNHLQLCQQQNIPFLVAMSGYRNPHLPIADQRHRVIGFAFLDIASRGLFGSTESNGKHSGRLYVMVNDRFRNNRVATALIDRMLIITSRGYLEKEASYQWVNPKNDPAYFPEGRSPRQWRTIQMEIYLENRGCPKDTKDCQEYNFIRDWLQLDFNFTEENYTSNYAIADHLLNKPLDCLVLEHQCI
ncbi:hypothetical protein BJ166DRAFT_610468 [Pestalotiopsis sp. NC0098]|nr:hypothetical protein BJ166DRAFT_610468 [Pestalotiopsis sp. NC0098]